MKHYHMVDLLDGCGWQLVSCDEFALFEDMALLGQLDGKFATILL